MVTEQHVPGFATHLIMPTAPPAWEAESEGRSVPIGPRMRMILSERVVMH